MSQHSKPIEDRIYQQCLLQITPTDISYIKPALDSSQRAKSEYTILVKLGNLTEKRQRLNDAMEFNMTVSYSKALMKYYPIKGMIKVYDKCGRGSEMILGVGGFSTDEILNQGKNKTEITKEVGPVEVKMSIGIQKKNHQATQSAEQNSKMFKKDKPQSFEVLDRPPDIQVDKKGSLSSIASYNRQDLEASQFPSPVMKNSTTQRSKLSQAEDRQNKIKVKLVSSERFNRDQDNECFSVTESEFNREIIKKQMDTLGQQLICERKNVQVLQQKLSKSHLRNTILKQKVIEYSNELQSVTQKAREVIFDGIRTDKNGDFMIANDQKVKQVRISYRSLDFWEKFISLIDLLVSLDSSNHQRLTGNSNHGNLESNPILEQIDEWQREKIKILEESQRKEAEIRSLKNFIREKKNMLCSQQNLERRLGMQREEIIRLQERMERVSEQMGKLQESNRYFKEKESQAQSMIFAKDSTIEHLGKLISNQNKDIERLNKENDYFKKSLQNLDLQIEELQEEACNLNEVIEKYRNKYGDLGRVKNKALENQIKECIRWIDSQARDQDFNEAEETMQSEFSHTDTFSEVIRSIQIESLPIEEITGIRGELVKILDKVDGLLKNAQPF